MWSDDLHLQFIVPLDSWVLDVWIYETRWRLRLYQILPTPSLSKWLISSLKGLYIVIWSDSSCKDCNVRFTIVTLKLCCIKYELNTNHVLVSLNCLFPFAGSLRMWLAHCMLIRGNVEKLSEFNTSSQQNDGII